MYSVVMMMALSGSADAPEFGGCRCTSACKSSCKSSCKGSRCHGCTSCRGSSCHGCRGCHGRQPRCCGCTGTVVVTCACAGTTPPAKKDMPGKKKKAPNEVDAPAVIQVTLPADARLTVDGHATTSSSATRTFVTPALPEGEFQYTLRAEVVRDGRTVVETQVVTVRGGEETRVPFNFSTGVIAAR